MPEKQKTKRPVREYRVVATYIDRPSEKDYAANLKEVRELEHFFKRHGCDGLRVEKWVEGIGYVLNEGNQ